MVIICVPTPLNKTKEPDNSFIMMAAEDLQAAAAQGHADHPRVDDLPRLHARDAAAQAAGVAGSRSARTSSSASRPSASIRATRSSTPRTRPRSSAAPRRAASRRSRRCTARSSTRWCRCRPPTRPRWCKLLENTFRAVNIGLVNEVAIMCHKLGHQHLGGHRRRGHQAVRLHALLSRARASAVTASRSIRSTCRGSCKTLKYEARFIELADEINSHMPHLVVEKTQDALNEQKKAINGSKVLVLGIAYKKDIDDVRESPALDIIELLAAEGRRGQLPRSLLRRRCASASTRCKSVPLEKLDSYDCVVDRHRSHERRLQAGGGQGQGHHRHAQRHEERQGRRARQDHLAVTCLRRVPQLRSMKGCGTRSPSSSSSISRSPGARRRTARAQSDLPYARPRGVLHGAALRARRSRLQGDRQGRRGRVRLVRVRRRRQDQARLARAVRRWRQGRAHRR